MPEEWLIVNAERTRRLPADIRIVSAPNCSSAAVLLADNIYSCRRYPHHNEQNCPHNREKPRRRCKRWLSERAVLLHGGHCKDGRYSSRRKRSRNRNDVHQCFADFFRFHKRFLSTLFICTRSCIPKTPGGSDLPPLLLIQVQLPSALFEILLIYMPDCRKSACILLKKVIKYRCLIFVPCIRMRFCRVCSAFCGFSFNRIQSHTRQIRQGGVTKWVSFVKYAVRAQ